ncbi:MAG: alkaline phosphatase family protein [Actinomycetaceae bacterium]|nr:alkaline phosphatase family protein [Actinomycetaceae bacterium]
MTAFSPPAMPRDFVTHADLQGRRVWQILPAALSAVPALQGLSFPGASTGEHDSWDFPQAQRVCVALIDGMGWHMLNERLAYAPFLRQELRNQVRDLNAYTCVPSTTASAITSITVGRGPGQTNMLGYQVRDPKTAEVFSLISFEDAPCEPEIFQPHPTLFETLVAAGFTSDVLGPKKFIGRGLTRTSLRGARYVTSETLDARIACALDASYKGTTLTYFYWAELDHVGHSRGWKSEEWAHELEVLSSGLEQLAKGLAPGTLLIVTADHGMVDTDPSTRFDLASKPEIAQSVEAVAGEPRALQIFTRAGHGSQVKSLLKQWLGDLALVLDRNETALLIGEVARPEILGDVCVFMSGNAVLVDSRFHSAKAMELPGVHGSLTEAEMCVPALSILV